MQQNAWEVAKELVERIDGAPVMGEMIKAYLSEDENQFFFQSAISCKVSVCIKPDIKRSGARSCILQ